MMDIPDKVITYGYISASAEYAKLHLIKNIYLALEENLSHPQFPQLFLDVDKAILVMMQMLIHRNQVKHSKKDLVVADSSNHMVSKDSYEVINNQGQRYVVEIYNDSKRFALHGPSYGLFTLKEEELSAYQVDTKEAQINVNYTGDSIPKLNKVLYDTVDTVLTGLDIRVIPNLTFIK